jgi:hypothetical protein
VRPGGGGIFRFLKVAGGVFMFVMFVVVMVLNFVLAFLAGRENAGGRPWRGLAWMSLDMVMLVAYVVARDVGVEWGASSGT